MNYPSKMLSTFAQNWLPATLFMVHIICVLPQIACSDDLQATRATLCDPKINTVTDSEVSDSELPLSIVGGSIRIQGSLFWSYFSDSDITLEQTPDADTSPTPPSAAPFVALDSLVVYVGYEARAITSAYEQSVWPPVTYYTLAGESVVADCELCQACLAEVSAQTGTEGVEDVLNACGGCEQSCSGCQQVIELDLDELSSDAGMLSSDGLWLDVPVIVFGSLGQTPIFEARFALPCNDGRDNDGDTLIDGDDPECSAENGTGSE